MSFTVRVDEKDAVAISGITNLYGLALTAYASASTLQAIIAN